MLAQWVHRRLAVYSSFFVLKYWCEMDARWLFIVHDGWSDCFEW